MKKPHRFGRSAIVAGALTLAGLLGACTSDAVIDSEGDGIEEDAEITPSDQQINRPANGVEQGNEGGLDLDSGNIPGSPEEQREDIAQRPEGRYNESLGEPDEPGDE